MKSYEAELKKIIPIQPAEEPELISLYAAHQKIHPRTVSGFFSKWRWAAVFITQIVFFGLPWLQWGQRQAVLFDVGARRFYLFGLVLYPQDFIYLTGLLVIAALSLFLFTAVAGRLWCGYACPQTVYTEMFMWVERRFEGDRQARIRLDEAPWSMKKLGQRGGKHLVWVLLALWTGFTFVGYFTPIQSLGSQLLTQQTGAWENFWVLFYGFATYGNAGFMREQVCKYMCPYARFQSAMFDKDTLIVTYDQARGEPRGAPRRKSDLSAPPLGACVDCDLCVQVCPTGIDIRNGLQYECIGCGACADVCDKMMDKLKLPRGLVRYSTQNAMAGKFTRQQMLQRVLRPRVLVYGAILLTIFLALMTSLSLRVPLKVDVVRDRGAMSRIVAGGRVENVYRLQLMNATEQHQQYRITASGLDGVAVASESLIDVGPAQARWVPVRVQLPYGAVASGSHAFRFDILGGDGARMLSEKSVFIVPQ